MQRRRNGFFAVMAALALMATACGGGDDGPEGVTVSPGALKGTSITFSDSVAGPEQPAVKEVLSMFEQRTGAKVNLTQVTSGDLVQKLKVETKGDRNTIHLIAQDNLALAPLVEDNLVQELPDFELPSEVLPALVPQKFDGKQYFLPYRPNVRVTYVNKDRFGDIEPPTTAEEFRTVAEQLKSKANGQPKVTLSFANQPDTGPLGVTISEWVVSFGGNPLILNDEGSVAAFTFLQDLWQDELLVRESLQAKYDTEVDYLRGETAWLATNWPFTSATLNDAGILEKFDVYEGWSGPEREAHVIGGEVLGIPTGVSGKEKEAAEELARFLMSKEAQEILVAKNAWPSVRGDALAQVPPELKQTFDSIQAALENGWYRPNVVYWSDVEAAMDQAVRRIVVGNSDVKSTLDSLHERIERAAKKKDAEYPPAA